MAQVKILTCKAKAKSNPTKRTAKAKKTTKRPAAKRKTAKKKAAKRPAKSPVKKTVKKAAPKVSKTAKLKVAKHKWQTGERPRKAPMYVLLGAVPNLDFEGSTYGYGKHAATVEMTPKWIAVKDLRQARDTVQAFIAKHELGGGNFIGGDVVSHNGDFVAHISYNGRIWDRKTAKAKEIVLPNPSESRVQRAGAATKRVTKRVGAAAKEKGKDLAKRAGAATKKAAKRGAKKTAEVTSKAAKRVGRKTAGVAKEAWKGVVKGWKENPTVPKDLFKPISKHGAKKNPTSKEKPFLAWTNAPQAYDYWYVEDTGEVVKGFRLVKVTDRMRWENFQVPRYGSGLYVAFEANDKVQLKNFGLPAKRSVKTKSVKSNPVRTGSYVYRIAYEIWDEEDAEAGETYKRGWEIEESDHFDTLDDLLQEVAHSGFWLEWSSSHPDSNSWIVSESDQDYRTGAYTSRHLFIERTDKKPLTTSQLKHINKRLGLRGQFSGVKSNPSKDQLHLTQRRGKFFTIMDQEHIPVPATRAQAALASGEAVKVPWGHAKLPHHARSEKLVSDKQLGAMLHNWHVGMGDPIYAAGSTLYAGHPTSLETLEDALSGIRGIKSSSKSRHNKKDHQELVAIERNLEHRISLMKAKGIAIPKNNPTGTGAKPPAYLKKDAKATRAILSTEKLEDGRICFTFEWANPFALAIGCGETAAKAAAMLYIHWPHSITPPISESGKRLLWAKKNPTNAATGKVPVTSIQLHRMGNNKIEAVANVVREGNNGSLWAKANLEIQHWVNVSKTKTRAIPVNFVITYADGQTYSGQYVGVGGKQNLSGHIITVLNAVTGKKAPSGMTKSDYERTLNKIKPAERKKWQQFLAKYDVGCTKCAKSNPTNSMNLETHETVWGLGAEAGRKTKDLDGSFLSAVKKYGKRVFPAASVKEDDRWFDEYFSVFREGFNSSKRSQSTATKRTAKKNPTIKVGDRVSQKNVKNISGKVLEISSDVDGMPLAMVQWDRGFGLAKSSVAGGWYSFYDLDVVRGNPASSGYGYVYRGRNWRVSKDDKWDTEVVDGGGVFVGTRIIDGSRVKVYKTGINEYVAQTHGA